MPETSSSLGTTPISDAYPTTRLRPQLDLDPERYLRRYMQQRYIVLAERARELLIYDPTEMQCRWSRFVGEGNGLRQKLVIENVFIDRGYMILPPTPPNPKIAVLKKLGLNTSTRRTKHITKSQPQHCNTVNRHIRSTHRTHSNSKYPGR